MRSLLRLSVCAVTTALLLLGVWSAARCASLPVPDLGLSDLRRLLAEEERGQALTWRCELLRESSAARQLVVHDLLDGRLTLQQAVVAFRRQSEANGADLDVLPSQTGAATLDGALARCVLSWANGEVGDCPTSPRRAALARLEAEYAAAFHRPYPYSNRPVAH
jgi:hypothetical protein